jgi:2-amino-4-hydroxy-6-hydroxymethyldihydropteridine diphosphokinase
MRSGEKSAWVALGSNLSSPQAQIETALGELDSLPESRVTARSSLYRSAPLHVPSPQPDYVNAVARLATTLSPGELLSELQSIERRHGLRSAQRNAPRVLDLDLVAYEEAESARPELTLPHPRAHQRAFVLQPLLEIDPEFAFARHGAARRLLENLVADPEQRVERIVGTHLPEAAA